MTSDAGLLLPLELNERLGLSALIERHRFETEVLAEERNYQGRARLNTPLIRHAVTRSMTQPVTLDIDSSESLFPRVGFIVTTLTGTNRAVVRFYNRRGPAEQWIKARLNCSSPVSRRRLSLRRRRRGPACAESSSPERT